MREEVGTIDAARFVAHVQAVVLMVALVAAVDASAIAAFELIGAAGGMYWGAKGRHVSTRGDDSKKRQPRGGDESARLPQSASSDRSEQSAPPSHFQLLWMHSPLPLHRNSRDEHS